MAAPDDGEIDTETLERALSKVANTIDDTVRDICEKHHDALTQEHQFTSRLIEAIERELKHIQLDGVDLQVDARDFPDKGPGSLEKKTGADVYISVVRTDGGQVVSKGMLVQSKWEESLSDRRELSRLGGQVGDMLRRTNESYIWIYRKRSVAVLRTNVAQTMPGAPVFQSVGNMIASGLRCNAGDPEIGRDVDLPLRQSLDSIMEELGTESAVSFKLASSKRQT